MKYRCLMMVLFVLALSVDSAFARPRRFYRPSTTTNNTVVSEPVVELPAGVEKVGSYTSGSDDQSRCQAEADYMASHGIRGHVWGCIGRFEGVGFGHHPHCNTCTPGGSMTPTGDASAQGRDGLWYRVRSWR